jgi:AcrR family transcriptional regulator
MPEFLQLKPTTGGRREANKREKLARIREAAREIFIEKGFAQANLREIAHAAHVGFGTLFLYAKDKEDLLLLLFDEELPLVGQRAFGLAGDHDNFIDQVMIFFSEFYKFFLQTPQLSRDMLREIAFGRGIVAQRMWLSIVNIEQHLARLVAKAQADGLVNSGLTPDLVAHVLFSLYRVEIRFCLDAEEPNASASLAVLRQQCEVFYTGLRVRGEPHVAPLTQPFASRNRRAARDR